MRIYFTCSARGEEEFGKSYLAIFNAIKDLGHSHVFDYREDNDPNKIYASDHEYKVKMYREHIKNIRTCDALVIEVSTHSLSMGYLIKEALEVGKPVIALHLRDHEPAFVMGIENDKLQVVEYNLDNIKTVLTDAIDFAREQSDIRFNFFISPSISNYLDWIAKNRRIPRSVYLRRLIEADMKQSEDYKKAA